MGFGELLEVQVVPSLHVDRNRVHLIFLQPSGSDRLPEIVALLSRIPAGLTHLPLSGRGSHVSLSSTYFPETQELVLEPKLAVGPRNPNHGVPLLLAQLGTAQFWLSGPSVKVSS